jgi:ATP-dependent RNA helicase DDX5/DBP2
VEEIRRRMDVIVEILPGESEAPPPIESFEDMNLSSKIMLDIKFHEYEKPTPIQAQAIPIICSGRDVLGCAETGSGKTAAFSIPMIQHCLNQPEIRRGDGPIAIVMAPTRELAQQIEKEAKIFSRSSKGFKTTIVGGRHEHVRTAKRLARRRRGLRRDPRSSDRPLTPRQH